jgi:hypothetical protein
MLHWLSIGYGENANSLCLYTVAEIRDTTLCANDALPDTIPLQYGCRQRATHWCTLSVLATVPCTSTQALSCLPLGYKSACVCQAPASFRSLIRANPVSGPMLLLLPVTELWESSGQVLLKADWWLVAGEVSMRELSPTVVRAEVQRMLCYMAFYTPRRYPTMHSTIVTSSIVTSLNYSPLVGLLCIV